MASFLAQANIPLISIPLYYFLATYPHGHAVALASKGDLSNHDNRNPKGSVYSESVRRRLSPRDLAAWERAESCHRNALENMPLFVSAIFAGLLAERAGGGAAALGSVGSTTTFALGWLGLRTAYTVAYLITESKKWSNLRSLLYFISTGWAFALIGKAAFVVGA